MKHTYNFTLRTLCLGVYLPAFSLLAFGQVTEPVVSNTTWGAADANDNPLPAGPNAQNVCIGTNSSNCATGATQYGGGIFNPDPWIDPSQLGYPNATWIWAPGITGTTSPSAPQTFWFTRTFYLCGVPPYKDGTLSVAADNIASVYVNNVPLSFPYTSATTDGTTTTFIGTGMTALPTGTSFTVAGDSNLSYDVTYTVVTSSATSMKATSTSAPPSGAGTGGSIYETPFPFSYTSATTSGTTTTFNGTGMAVLLPGTSFTVIGDSNLSYDVTYTVGTSTPASMTASSTSGTPPSGSSAGGSIIAKGSGPQPIATSTTFTAVTTVTVPGAQLVPGQNTITILATNIASPGCDNYQCNPAGVLFGATFTDSLSTEPTCSGDPLGTVQTKPGSPGCEDIRVCACLLGNGVWTPWTAICGTTTAFTIGGTISGLTGSGLVLQDDGTNNLTVSAGAPSFAFSQTVPAQSPYDVTVLTQPSNPAENCTVANGTGTATGNVTNIAITCTCINGQTQSISCPEGQTGSQTETCQNGTWSVTSSTCCPNASACTGTNGTSCCAAGQLCCIGSGPAGNRQCVTPVSMPMWCAQVAPTYMDCSVPPASLCAAFPGTTCQPMPPGALIHDEWTCQAPSTGGGSGGGGNSGGSDVALLTFLALTAVWSIANIWRRRRMASR